MNQVLIQLIYFVIYSVVFLVIGKLSFSESDSLSKFVDPTADRKKA